MSVPTYPGPGEAQHEAGTLVSRDGTRLHWQRYAPPRPRATVAVVPGTGDHGGRYPALTRALVEAGFAVALVDLRGFGRSEGRRGHVERFADYHDDVDAFVGAVRERAADQKLFVAGHSLGGLVVATWGMLPGRRADGVILSSPWFRFAVEPPRLKVLAARLVGKLLPWLPISTALSLDALTTDEELQAWTDQDPLYGRKITPRWFEACTAEQATVLARAGTFRHPLLVLAGSQDGIADPAGGEAFADQAGSADRTFTLYDGLRHEIWNERERARTVGDAVAWVAARA